MKKPGRNEPCHCGSGKKYKKCCEQKDELEAIALVNADPFVIRAMNGTSGNNGADDEAETLEEMEEEIEMREWLESEGLGEDDNPNFDQSNKEIDDDGVDGRYPTISADDEKVVDDWCKTYDDLDLKDIDAIQSHLDQFILRRPDLVENLGLEHEVLFDLGANYFRQGRAHEYAAFLLKFRQQFPSTYIRSAGYYDKDIIAFLIAENRHDEIGNYLNYFSEHPVRFYTQLVVVKNLMLATNVVHELVPLLNRVAKPLLTSTQIFGVPLAMQPILSDIFGRHIETVRTENDVRKFVTDTSNQVPFELENSDSVIAEWLDLFNMTRRPFTLWPTKLPSKASDREALIAQMANNFSYYLHKHLGISWMSARHYNIILEKFLEQYWKVSSSKHETFVFQSKRVASVASSMASDGLFTDTTLYMSCLNALYYFADYLKLCGNLNEDEAQKLHEVCKAVYDDALDEEPYDDMEILCFESFPIFGPVNSGQS